MGTTEIVIIVIVLVILFGANKVNEWSKGLGEATKEVKKLKKDIIEDVNSENKDQEDEKKDEEDESGDDDEEEEEAAIKKPKSKKLASKKTGSRRKNADPLPEGDKDNVWSKFN